MRAHFPSQPIDDYTADALGELLEPYTLADCRAAVLRLAKRNHESDVGRAKWCSPTDVYAEVRRDRAKRISEADPIELGDVDPDNTAAYIARLVEARRLVADGNPPPAAPVAVEGRRDVIRELGQAQSIDSALATRPLREAHAEAKRELQAAEADRIAARDEKQARLEAMRAADRAERERASAARAAITPEPESEAS
jgi:hypothetical protein